MGLLQKLKDRNAVADVAPGMVDQVASVPGPIDPHDPMLRPIAGVDLVRYAQLSKATAPYGMRTQEQVDDYVTRAGHTPERWQEACSGWSARFKVNTAVATLYAQHFRAVVL